MTTRRQFLQFSALISISSLLGLQACSSQKAKVSLSAGSQVTALGDSLTFGYGVGGSKNGQDYPSQLAKLTKWQITNAGINGDTSQDILDRLNAVIEQKPQLVLLGIGGNDVLQRVKPATTKANIIKIVQNLNNANIPVVLIAQPHFSASALLGHASDNPIYQPIADQLDVPLYADGWSNILSDKTLKSDQIHANAQGYQKFAEGLYAFLKEVGYA